MLPAGPQTPQQALPTLRPTPGSPAVRPVEAAPCRKIPRDVGADGAKKVGATKASVNASMVSATATLTTTRSGIGTALLA
jgi:hypothetical protein